MKYLKKVTLINFQSHKNSTIEFDKGLNVIVGPSDSGKSAIIRGIKWALYNDPLGDYYIREGETETSVTLEFSNNIKIKRLRNRSRNAYILYNTAGDEIVFEGFGSKVPEEIIEILSIKKIPLDNNETNAINLSEQLEGAFLLSQSGSVRASAIGRLVGVNLIDDALKDTLKDIRNVSINKKSLAETVDKIDKELIKYLYLDELKEKINIIDDIKERIMEKYELKNQLIKNIKIYNDIIEEKNHSNDILYKLNTIDILESDIYMIENKMMKLKRYKNLNVKLDENKKQSEYNKKLLNKLKNIGIMEKKINLINKNKTSLEIFIRIQKNINENKKEIKDLKSIIKKLIYIEHIQKEISIIENKINRFIKLDTLKKRLNSINKSLIIGAKYTEKLKGINQIEKNYEKLNNLLIKRESILKKSKVFYSIKEEIIVQKKNLNNIKREIDINLKKYEDIFKESSICPFCLSYLDNKKIDHIVDHYK